MVNLRERKNKPDYTTSRPITTRRTSQKRKTSNETPRNGKKQNQKLYDVEKVLEHRQNKEGGDEYLVKWEGYDPKYNSWESKDSFTNDTKIKEFERLRTEMQAKQEDHLHEENGIAELASSTQITTEIRSAAEKLYKMVDDNNAAEGNATHPKNDSNQPKYIIQRHDKPEIFEIVGVKAGDNDIEGGKRELVALVAYVDNTFEFVPTSVLKEFAPVHLSKFYETKLTFTDGLNVPPRQMQSNVNEVKPDLAESVHAFIIKSTSGVNLPNSNDIQNFNKR